MLSTLGMKHANDNEPLPTSIGLHALLVLNKLRLKQKVIENEQRGNCPDDRNSKDRNDSQKDQFPDQSDDLVA